MHHIPAEGINKFDFSTPVVANITLYALWEKKIIKIDGSASNNRSPIAASAFNECDFPGKLHFIASGSNTSQDINVYRVKDGVSEKLASGCYSMRLERTVIINDTMKGYSLTASQYNCSAVGLSSITYEALDD